MEEIETLAKGYKFESMLDQTPSQVIILAKKNPKSRASVGPLEKVFLKIGLDKDSMASIKHEYKLLSKLSHPHILKPQSHKKGKSEGGKYRRLSYSFQQNGDLWSLTEKMDGLGENLARVYGLQILSAIDYLHSKRIAHRDLKLDNVIVKDDLDVAIIDFDLAYESSNLTSVPNEKVKLHGTKGYFPPELWEFQELVEEDPLRTFNYLKADAFAFGVMMF